MREFPYLKSINQQVHITPLPRSDEYGVRFVNSAPCNITISSTEYDDVTISSRNVSIQIAKFSVLNKIYT